MTGTFLAIGSPNLYDNARPLVLQRNLALCAVGLPTHRVKKCPF